MKGSKDKLIIGTRGSKLALWQANELSRLLKFPAELKIIKTSGDRFLDQPLQGRLEKGFFTREIEEHLLSQDIDLAVHSLKDLPTEIDPRLTIAAYLPRGPVNDLLLIRPDGYDPEKILPLKDGCLAGATALRRQALLRLYGPQAKPMLLRGNVPTRIRKIQEGRFGAIIIAQAGVERLGLDLKNLIGYELNPEFWLPAPGQAVIAVEARADDEKVLRLLSGLDHQASRDAVMLERKILANFGGGCHTAFGAYARPENGQWKISVGIEHQDLIWVQTTVVGAFEECWKHGPKTLSGMKPADIKRQEELCRRIQ